MLKRAFILLFAVMLLGGCAPQRETVVFTGEIMEIAENGILVSTQDLEGTDQIYAWYDKDMEPVGFDLFVGQKVKVTIWPEIRESYPPQATAVKLEEISG